MTADPEAEAPGPAPRGVAKVVKPPGVRAFASVPGALSVPRRPARRWPSLASRAVEFPRRLRKDPPEPPPATTPPLRPAVPAATVHTVREKPRKGSHGLLLPVVVGAVAAFAAGSGYLAVTDRPLGRDPGLGRWAAVPATATAIETATATGTGRPAGDPFGSVTAAPSGPPTRLRIAAIGVDTPLETLRLGSDGALQPPKSFGRAGWYADGTAPGDNGPAVLAGHVDSKAGPAVFYRLRELTAGDPIEVTRGGRTVRFVVVRTAWYPKAKFPTAQVYGPTPDRQLRLITCGGVFDHSLRSYKDNLVVYAVSG
nr:class F sortase [uncultured Actinoplanes sp.]